MLIIGGGLAGISAALHLKRPFILLEASDRLGGLARTEERDGFFFDHTGHWLHLRDPYMKQFVADRVSSELVEVNRIGRASTSNGTLTQYPSRANLFWVASGHRARMFCSASSGKTRRRERFPAPKNFEDYILMHFGEGIAKHFMIPYNTKLWGVHPREITSAWCSRFVPIPNLEQVVAGAVGASPATAGVQHSFRYPRRGGIETFSRALAENIPGHAIRLNTPVTKIPPEPPRSLRCEGKRTLLAPSSAAFPCPV